MRRAAVLVGAMTAAALLLLGAALLVYNSTGDEDSASSSRVIDEQRGSYRGVELGSTREEAEDALGDAPDWRGTDPLGPLQPGWQRGAPNTAQILGTVDALRYPQLAAHLGDDEVVELIIAEPGAKTTRNIGIGDRLAAVRRTYADLPCGQTSGQARGPYCGGQIAPQRWLWFGGDPVRSITLASVQLS
jgi:hypothetical protein